MLAILTTLRVARTLLTNRKRFDVARIGFNGVSAN